MKKNITIIIPRLDEGGVSRVFLNLAREFIKKGIAVHFVTRTAESHFISNIQDNAELSLSNKDNLFFFLVLIFKTLFSSNKKTIITAGEDISCYAVFINLILLRRHRIIITIHSNIEKSFLAKNNFLLPVRKRFLSFFFKRSNNLIAVSQGVAQNLKKTLELRDKIINVIYNPVITDDFYHKMREFSAPRTSNDEKIIIYVGRLSKEKCVDTIIKSYFLISKKIPNSKLWIIGDGSEKTHLQEIALSEKCGGKIIFFGHQENPLPFIYSSNVLVLASDWEGFGNVIVEALACGTNVVSHNCPDGPAEILDFGRYGYLINENSPAALAHALKNQLTSPLCSKDELANRGRFFSSRKAADLYMSFIR